MATVISGQHLIHHTYSGYDISLLCVFLPCAQSCGGVGGKGGGGWGHSVGTERHIEAYCHKPLYYIYIYIYIF